MPGSAIAFLPAADLAATRAYYLRLGLELALDQGSCIILRAAPTAFWGFCEADSALSEASRVTLTLVTEDVDGTYARWTELGVKTDGAPRINPRFQIYHFFAEEPSGYRLEVQRFLDERWND